jgi:hypothetical protein
MNEFIFALQKHWEDLFFPSLGANQEDLLHVSLFII